MIPFEKGIARLEEIVSILSSKAVTLEESLKLFTEGASLIETCQKQLSDAKLKVEELFPEKDGEKNDLSGRI